MLTRYSIINNTISANEPGGKILLYTGVNEEEKKEITGKYGIDSHSIASSLDTDEVPRIETDGRNINLIWKTPTTFRLGDMSSFNVLSAGFFIRDNELIIISRDEIPYLAEKKTIPIKNIYDLLIFIQDASIKHFIEHLKAIKLISRDIQKKINESMGNEYLLKMFDLSEMLVYYIDAINGNKSVLLKFSSALKAMGIQINYDFVQDILIEIEQAGRQAEIYSQVFAGMMDARGSIVNNNMNQLIKNLTIINIIFLPLNLIASIGGMSEFSVMTKKVPWTVSYSLLVLAMVLIGWLTLMFINMSSRKKKESIGHGISYFKKRK